MRLEAKDKQNPSLICVATICKNIFSNYFTHPNSNFNPNFNLRKFVNLLMFIMFLVKVKPNGEITIHFDGWRGDRYDYVTTIHDKELHPIGWFAQKAHLVPGLNRSLQQPGG